MSLKYRIFAKKFMAHLIIKNIGPIKSVEFDLNKINLFMGPQSCGKSTVVKIISYCSWFEKNMVLKTKSRKDFYKELIEFHNLEDSYFSDNSYIEYVTSCSRIVFKGNNKENPTIDIKVDHTHKFENHKIEYIPAERNFVSLKGLGKYTDSRDNILNFLYDWFQAKQEKTKDSGFVLPLPSLGVTYFYDKDQDADNILMQDGKSINLRHSSSGLMSITPLLLIFDYVMKQVYTQKRTKSPLEITNIQTFLQNFDAKQADKLKILQKRLSSLKSDVEKSVKEETSVSVDTIHEQLNELQEDLNNLIGLYSDYFYSQVIIEEPELNLFPETQRDLVYYMLRVLNESKRKHILVMTTHSPYILFALNNCMMGGLVKEKITAINSNSFLSHRSWVEPHQVSVYEIHDGYLKCIQDEDGIIEDNYLNQAYKENSSEYLALLDYYEDGE